MNARDFELVKSFYDAFHDASLQSRPLVLREFCDRIRSRYHGAVSDAQAIITAVESCDKNLNVDSLRRIVVPTGPTGRTKANSEYRKSCAIKSLIAIWSWEKVTHYGFAKLGTNAAETLVRAAKRFPRWQDFSRVANCAMIMRHEQSVQAAKCHAIGYDLRSGSRTSSSCLVKSDIDSIADKLNESALAHLEIRVRKWLRPCACLHVGDFLVTGQQLQLFAVELDLFGLLVPAQTPPRVLSDCEACLVDNDATDHTVPPAAHLQRMRQRKGDPSERPRKRLQLSDTECEDRDISTGSTLSDTTGSLQTSSQSSPRHASEEPYLSRPQSPSGLQSTASLNPDNGEQCSIPYSQTRASTRTVTALTAANTTAHQNPWRSREWAMSGLSVVDQFIHACSRCNGSCRICVVPPQYSRAEAEEFQAVAHDALDIPDLDPTADPWTSPIHFASPYRSPGLTPPTARPVSSDEADVWILSWSDFRERAERLERFPKPLLIRQDHDESVAFDLSQYLDLMRENFLDKRVSVHVGVSSRPCEMDIDTFASRITAADVPLNLLSMDDITDCAKPGLTYLYRFCLLRRLVRYCKTDLAEQPRLAQKQLIHTPYDVRSCTQFNILASRGAFSGPHRDSLGATWVRMLFGEKLWWVIPHSENIAQDLNGLERDGPSWDPRGRARALLLKKGDVLVMPHEQPVIHAVLTVQTALMDGGMFWDEASLEPLLEFLIWTADHQNTTNEPIALQLPMIIAALDKKLRSDVAAETENHLRVLALIKKFQALRCTCGRTCKSNCTCRRSKRRCWMLCENHPSTPNGGTMKLSWSCMRED